MGCLNYIREERISNPVQGIFDPNNISRVRVQPSWDYILTIFISKEVVT